MLYICLAVILICVVAVACAAFCGKNFSGKDDIFSKILFLNTSTSLASLFICFLGSVKANSSYLDIALIYFLLSVIASGAYLKYFLQKSQTEEADKI